MAAVPTESSSASPSSEPHPSVLIPAPFDVPDEADLVIRTSDNAHLFVLKAFLTYNSQFFRNVLSDSLPSQSYQNLPLLPIDENSRTMIAVMRLCYPIHISPAEMLIVATVPVIQALRKYIMTKAEHRFLDAIMHTELGKNHSLRFFAIARSYDYEDLAAKAVKQILRIPLSEWEGDEELRTISALDYHRLVDYYKRCGQAVPRAVSPELDVLGLLPSPVEHTPYSSSVRCQICTVPLFRMSTGTPISYGHPWVQDYLNQSQTRIGQWRSAGFLDQASEDLILEKAVKSCASQTVSAVRRTLQALENAIEREISKVEIVLD
ncbi:hypothetical protein CPB85DRAFT_291303 [Mucidula mucida]|nr:hypothetical protein CPB85DRAFT_291303 [Mucidula mucida]